MFGLMTVSRHDRELAEWKVVAEMATRNFAELQARYHELVGQYFDALTPKTVPIEKREPDPITQAITAVAGNNMKLRGLMARQAMQDEKDGIAREQIVGKIYAGITSDDGISA